MSIGFVKADVEKMPTKQLESLSPVIRELWVDDVDELISSQRLGDYWLIERELRKRFLA